MFNIVSSDTVVYTLSVANCPVFNRTVRYFGDLSGLKMKAKPDMHAFVWYINPVILAHALVHCRWDEMSGIFECAVWQP